MAARFRGGSVIICGAGIGNCGEFQEVVNNLTKFALSAAAAVCSAGPTGRLMADSPRTAAARGTVPTAQVPAADRGTGLVADLSSGERGEAAGGESLNNLKRRGAARSAYRNFQEQTVSTEAPEPNLKAFERDIRPILQRACVSCHGAGTQEGNIRIDTLDPNLLHGEDIAWWVEVRAVLSNGEMPPADADELDDADRARIVEWLAAELQRASQVRRAAEQHSTFRRLTKYEFNYVLQDLLGLPYDFARDLPPDAVSEDGFQNSSEMLHMSVVQLEAFRELGRRALRRAVVLGPRPQTLHWGVSMQAAADREFRRQDEELDGLRQKFKDDPERLEQEVRKLTVRFQQRPGRAHYVELSTGRMAPATWRYPGARYAWAPAEAPVTMPESFDHVAVLPPGQKLIVELGDQIPLEGTMRVRIRASRANADSDHVPSLQLEFGWQASNDSHASTRISKRDVAITAPPDRPQIYQWDVVLGDVYPRNSVRGISKMGDLPSPSEYLKFVNSAVTRGNVRIDFVEVTAPVYEQWPPASHRRIFSRAGRSTGNSSTGEGTPGQGGGNGSRDAAGSDEDTYAREILTGFMSRAWRRPVTAMEVEQKIRLFTRIRPECSSFEEAMVEVLATVLSSPNFLYLLRSDQPTAGTPSGQPVSGAGDAPGPRQLSDFELATRLSMFLWCSMPDGELFELAGQRRLHQPEVLRQQVRRLLKDERSWRFSRHFVRQWLGMQLLDHLSVDRKKYPQFDVGLQEAMQQEPIVFFEDMLEHNRSVLDFIHADDAFVNERLAKHYGISGVIGNHFRRVELKPEHRRGGLLTQAGLLAMNSDGSDSHPLKRGIWMLENLLNDPPPPPPPAVPEIDLADPEIAKLTLKERIEQHRDHAACRSCHARIDPWGIAFENFDAVGGWRTQINGRPVDASSVLFNGHLLEGMDGLKRYLLSRRQDQLVRAVVEKTVIWALGRPLTFADHSGIDRLTADLRRQGDGLATMIELIAVSGLFRSL